MKTLRERIEEKFGTFIEDLKIDIESEFYECKQNIISDFEYTEIEDNFMCLGTYEEWLNDIEYLQECYKDLDNIDIENIIETICENL